MFRRLLLTLTGLLLGWYVLVALVGALASDETKITWLLEEMEDGYNDGRVGEAVGPLADDWRHAGHSVSRPELRRGLAAEFFRDRDPETKALRRRALVDWDSLAIGVGEGGATFEVDVSFERSRAGTWRPVWSARVRGELERRDGSWRIVRSAHEDLDGTLLSR